MDESGGGRATAETRKVIHDLRQPLAAAQMWLDLLADALHGQIGEKEVRYLTKVRAELVRLAGLMSVTSSADDAPREQALSAATGATPDAGSSAAADRQEEGTAALAGLSLLVVEDDDMTAEALQLALEGEGATVVVAATIAAGIDSFNRSRPDVVLSDLRVSDGDGFTLIAEIRRLDRSEGRRTVALAVTGFDGDETRAASRAAGFDELVLKPFTLGDLIDTVRRLVAARS